MPTKRIQNVTPTEANTFNRLLLRCIIVKRLEICALLRQLEVNMASQLGTELPHVFTAETQDVLDDICICTNDAMDPNDLSESDLEIYLDRIGHTLQA